MPRHNPEKDQEITDRYHALLARGPITRAEASRLLHVDPSTLKTALQRTGVLTFGATPFVQPPPPPPKRNHMGGREPLPPGSDETWIPISNGISWDVVQAELYSSPII